MQTVPMADPPGGQTNFVAPPGENQLSRDDQLRRIAAQRLLEHIETGMSLIAHCEHLANKTKGDRLGPLNAAARLLRANAGTARVLANTLQIERRQRSIVERIQTRKPDPAELNSKIFYRGVEFANHKDLLIYRLDKLLEAKLALETDTGPREEAVALPSP